MAHFVVAHGAWSAGFVWKKMHAPLGAQGHTLSAPTCTGLGERAHLVDRETGLETHIRDIIEHLEHEDLRDVILIGHSYGGITATGVADRVASRIKHLIYLDAFIPYDGASMMDLATPEQRATWTGRAAETGDGWLVSPNPIPPDTSAEDIAWIGPRRHPQPLKSMTDHLRLTSAAEHIPKSYIYCTRIAPGDMFGPFARAAEANPAWRYWEIDASHSPHVTAPFELAAVLDSIADL